ncbi:hypothetical protein [Cellulomonas endophytica]|uniref:hypothetical protein n=1 Tax=Cellulomonas endophytica TaxID=2494735 RepID=UPI001013003C|nr:hypothetical protein [Cellulomonas endophytica]
MTGPAALITLATACLVAGVVLVVVGLVRVSRARAVDRVRLPARLVSRTWAVSGSQVVVEYPAPDGSPLRASMFVWVVRAPGMSPGFDGTVWAARDDPSDVTPRRQGRTATGAFLAVLGGALLAVSSGLGITALGVAASATAR